VLGTARIAGMLAAKQTAQLIPLAHPIALSVVNIDASVDVDGGLVELVADVAVDAQTGSRWRRCGLRRRRADVYDMVKGSNAVSRSSR